MNRLPNTNSSSSRRPSRSEDTSPTRGGGNSSSSSTQSTAESSIDPRFLAQGARPRTTRQSPPLTTPPPIEKRQVTQKQNCPHSPLAPVMQRLEAVRYMATHAPNRTLLPELHATNIFDHLSQGNALLEREADAYIAQQDASKKFAKAATRAFRSGLTKEERTQYEQEARKLSLEAQAAGQEYDVALQASTQFALRSWGVLKELSVNLSLLGVLTPEVVAPLMKNPHQKPTPEDFLPPYDLIQTHHFTIGLFNPNSENTILPMYTHPSVQQASPPPYSPEDAERGQTILQNLPPAYEEPQGTEATPPPRRVDPQLERGTPPDYIEREEE